MAKGDVNNLIISIPTITKRLNAFPWPIDIALIRFHRRPLVIDETLMF